MDAVFALLIALHLDLHGIGDLLLVVEQYLFTNDLGDEETHGAVGELVFWEIGWALRQLLQDLLEDELHIGVVLCREREYGGVG